METRLVIALIAAAVLVSGCADVDTGDITSDLPDLSNSGNNPENPGDNSEDSSERSVEIEEFSVSDSDLTPGQTASVTLRVRNYNSEPVEMNEVSLYNTGFLTVQNADESWEERCSPDELEAMKEEVAPQMECNWVIEAPSESELTGFESKSVTMKLNLDYNATLSNSQAPLKIDFRPLSDIENTGTVSHTYSNGEVEMQVETESPVAIEQGTFIEFVIEPKGEGRVASDYYMDYSPEALFNEPAVENRCPRQIDPVLENRGEFSCMVKPSSGSSTVRNLIFSTSYKYVKSPNLDIEVVNQ